MASFPRSSHQDCVLTPWADTWGSRNCVMPLSRAAFLVPTRRPGCCGSMQGPDMDMKTHLAELHGPAPSSVDC